MPDEPQPGPDDDFQEMLRKLLSGEGQIDPSQLAGAAGLPNDPAFVANLMSQLQRAAQSGGDGIDFSATAERATAIAREGGHAVDPVASQAADQAFQVAALWLDEVTTVAELTATPSLYTREQWAKATVPVWTQIAEPVAFSIADALTEAIDQRAPEELKAMLGDVSKAMRGVGGALFAIQLGQVVGQLSKEVVSGGDVGVPLLDEQVAALLPQNVAEFAEGLDVSEDEVRIYLAVRELAHARLFRSARWLRLHIISSITDYARGIHIPFDRVEELAADIDPTNQEQLRDALASGALIPPRTPEQDAALARLETMLALVEGWVDTVTAAATVRLPKSGAIAEMVRRRRAAGGPAESAFATLVGLELRPRRLREAAAMWQRVTDELGAEQRDALWSHFDLVPTSDDVDAPDALVARLRNPAQTEEDDAFDKALEDLLNDATGARPHEDESGRIDDGAPGTDGTGTGKTATDGTGTDETGTDEDHPGDQPR
ncbi:putative hydrolase [Curtobacterium sp. PhB142]|uniref:zinc-dependent metalloprotease n=1 Tax=unclassified Curtobacterium TaxID=257496 RepID=UPI0010E973EC|nr:MULTISPECIES: zinc-dependent metalloprotease [unclassified Curtobacterium]TCL87560.1 putative hydrolase [Curtobacterium sp. PhB142]TCM05091.1 putative hydrolase [Curtobacterium sp. PhB134]TCU86567.1 putative hydrolase [Curtobacterium sp. PhB191]TDW51143.1 putative hydrolase [Curtobacterium sp. PhB42]TDW56011.1 putative hydrolase [Curtobacterium sp. PhB190]